MEYKKLIDFSKRVEKLFDESFTKEISPVDKIWKSKSVRKCHLAVIETPKIWMMHINIFPKFNYSTPILGFDIVSGQSKITGSFFDYSPVVNNHPYTKHFKNYVSDLEWSKPRKLPEWAQSIFSENMIAASNINTDEEVNQLIETCEKLIVYYVSNLKHEVTSKKNYKKIHNFYCHQQKQNPHLHRSLLNLGMTEKEKDDYVNNILFEEI